MYKVSLTDDIKKQLKPALWGNSDKVIFAEIARGVTSVFITAAKNMIVVGRMEGREFVVVAVVGKDLRGNRQDIINYAVANGAMTIRFHTRNPDHLRKGLKGLQVILSATKKRLFGRDEYIYKVSVA
ncbi:hypothetical protein [Neptunicella sp. SCSIO 80796]|uniref:hypothetical protein n=1 Tax=Neptunicella plasticusilytica TaxID=3117012 RepID=UPI003A4DF56D